VQEGVLYRGSQPSQKPLKHILDSYKVKTVVNLRGQRPKCKWWQVEQSTCNQGGARMIDIPIGKQQNLVWGLKQFLTLATDKANQPLFVHCEAGSARTGYAVAAYRIVAQGWSYEAAMNEAKDFRFTPDSHLNPEYDKILRELADGADWRSLGGSATSSPASATTGPHK
jgi:protein tyrosine/serine phosphatase